MAGRMGSMRGASGACRLAKRSIKTRSCSRFASRHLRVDSISACAAGEEPAEIVEVDDLDLLVAGVWTASALPKDAVVLLVWVLP